jgi:hypothetical protein
VADPRADHAGHDPIRVASLVGDRSPEDSDPVARDWVERCPDCASLHADLLALSVSTVALPMPARTRDFRIGAMDAARLLELRQAHATHDAALITALADRSIDLAERRRAEMLVASCADCSALHADVQAISDAVRTMATPARSVDYRLTEDDAGRLRRGGWRRLLGGLGGSRDVVTRPLAIGLTTLGLVGVLVTGAPSVLLVGSAASAPEAGGNGAVLAPVGDAARAGTSPAASANERYGVEQDQPLSVEPDSLKGPEVLAGATAPSAAALAPVAASPVAEQAPRPDVQGAEDASGDGVGPGASGQRDLTAESQALPTQTGGSELPATLLAAAFLVAGLGVFAIRWGARRFSDG